MTTRDQLQCSELDKIALFVAKLQHDEEPNNNATMTDGKRCRKSQCDNFDQRRCRANSLVTFCIGSYTSMPLSVPTTVFPSSVTAIAGPQIASCWRRVGNEAVLRTRFFRPWLTFAARWTGNEKPALRKDMRRLPSGCMGLSADVRLLRCAA